MLSELNCNTQQKVLIDVKCNQYMWQCKLLSLCIMFKDHIDIVNYTVEPLILLSSEALYRDGTGGPSFQRFVCLYLYIERFNGLAQNFVQTSTMPRCLILMTFLMSHWLFVWHHCEVGICDDLNEMSQPPLDGLPWNLVDCRHLCSCQGEWW